jgi:hypothetical protein
MKISGKDGLLGEIDETLSKTPLVLADEGRNLRRICCTCSRRVMALASFCGVQYFGRFRSKPDIEYGAQGREDMAY